ncbi:hypothetical protein CISIN_1g044446mg [Citrus sinensis]|uniref:Uncharacterized protein n=1 Tax=Citrus sinensis TaxID=2711 RepID=A0A067D6W8_CITSI|nr:hypothetical protein CISIN_1g044446mg [Citrus sinensis]
MKKLIIETNSFRGKTTTFIGKFLLCSHCSYQPPIKSRCTLHILAKATAETKKLKEKMIVSLCRNLANQHLSCSKP